MMNQPAREAFDTDPLSKNFSDTPPDRCSEIRRLLLDIMAQGPWPLEKRIDALSILRELSDSEREVVHQIYQLCYEAAERDADEKKMWRYQRLLRGMMLQQTAAPAGVQRRPDPLFCLELEKEFAVETEESATPSIDRFSPGRDANAAQRTSPVYDAVFPACVFVSAVLALMLTFPSGAGHDASNVPSALPVPSQTVEPLTMSVDQNAAHEPSELQLAEAAAASEADKEAPAKEPSGSATNSQYPKATSQPVESTMAQKPVAAATVTPVKAAIGAVAKPLTPKPAEPAKPSMESNQTDSDEGRTNLPARRSLGPSMVVPELEAQLEALKAQSPVDSRE